MLRTTLLCAALCGSICGSLIAADAPASIALVGGSIVDINGGPPLHDSVVLIEGDKITAIGSSSETNITPGRTPHATQKPLFCAPPV